MWFNTEIKLLNNLCTDSSLKSLCTEEELEVIENNISYDLEDKVYVPTHTILVSKFNIMHKLCTV